MAFNTHMSIASWNLALDAALNPLNSGFVEFYTGTQPATPETAIISQVLLGTCALGSTAFGASSSGVKTANSITNGTAVATGTATWARVYKSDGTTAVIDGSVGTSGTDWILNDVAITTGGTISVSSYTVSMPAGQ